MHRLRQRRRIARALDRAYRTRSALSRELRWAWRDLKDLHAELTLLTDKHVAGTRHLTNSSEEP
jgi:hypothetical protein